MCSSKVCFVPIVIKYHLNNIVANGLNLNRAIFMFDIFHLQTFL